MATAQRNQMYVTAEGDNGSAAATRAIALDANLAEAHAAMAGILASQGNYEAAQQAITIALRLDHESVDVLREAARLSFLQGRFEQAAAHWERVSALVETDYASGILLITCYTSLGDTDSLLRVARRTLARAEKAISVDADNGSAMAAVFSCLLSLGETDRAREWARRAVLIDPDNMTMRYNLACDLVINLGDLDLALEMLAPVCGRCGREQVEWMRTDPDLNALRDDLRFRKMIADAEARLATAGDRTASPAS